MRLRDLIKNIDRYLLGGKIRLQLQDFRIRAFYGALGYYFPQKFVLLSNNLEQNELNRLFELHGSDKGAVKELGSTLSWPLHSYGNLYELIFSAARQNVGLLVECGIGTNNPALKSSMGINGRPGASLMSWKKYFPNARIVGCDIDREILFTEDRIDTFYCDQTDPLSVQGFKEMAGLKSGRCDIIIDDGLHEYSAGITFFSGMIDCLAEDGTYIIEDVRPDDAIKYAEFFRNSPYRVVLFDVPRRDLPVGYNTILIIKKAAFGCDV